MFFKMLKNDLKYKKGLNIIIFIFIVIASVLVFVGSVQIYSTLSKDRTTEEVCRPSNVIMGVIKQYSTEIDGYKKIEPVLDKSSWVASWHKTRMNRVGYTSMDFPGYDENEGNLQNRVQFLTTIPLEGDYVYGLDDQPFYVENGHVAVSVTVRDKTGVKVGDKVKLTTVTGNVYELEISNFFKDNSMSYMERYIVSDADYEVLSADAVRCDTVYCIKLKENTFTAQDALYRELDNSELDAGYFTISTNLGPTNEDSMMEVISIFAMVACVFLILIIFMTIRFTMVAEMKTEEKEIGMMKALGVDSLSFRWLFAAKYIAFAVVGGVIGIIAGLPLSGIFINMFGPDCILPPRWQMILIGVIAVIATIAVMILFSLLVMRRINKISVIDAIHGENRGERFTKGFPMFLHRRKHMKIPFFLGITDVLGRLKRYLFLIIAYALGAAIILVVFNVRHSCISAEYMKNWMYHTLDFDTDFNSDARNEINKEAQRTGVYFYDVVNKRIEEAGIPARIEYMHSGSAELERNGIIKNFDLFWGNDQAEKFEYHEGGKAPVLANEAAMSAYTAKNMGISEGDVLKVTIYENNEDNTGSVENEKEIVITGLFDTMEDGVPSLIMGKEYDSGYKMGYSITGFVIDAPEEDKPSVIEQLRGVFGKDTVLTPKEAARSAMEDFDRLFALLEKVMTVVVILVLVLITYLYVNIFITEEASETALMKSMGFRGSTVKLGYIFRIAMLLIIGIVIGEIINWTGGSALYGGYFKQWDATGMKFIPEFPVSFIAVPLLVAGTVLLTTWLTAGGVRHIDIWKISEE